MIFSEVYFDESGTHNGSKVMTLAGYLFKDVQARRFVREWSKSLEKFGLQFAHQTDCANGNEQYRDISATDRDQSARALIQAIKRRTVLGFSVSVDPQMFADTIAPKYPELSAYSFCLMTCMAFVSHWVRDTQYDGKIAYFFESGHHHASQADSYIREGILAFPDRKDEIRYAAHSFVEKTLALPLQAADMLAWQHHHYLCRAKDGHEMRKDFKALLRPQDRVRDFTQDKLDRFIEVIETMRGGRS